jgi:hypothetical protein
MPLLLLHLVVTVLVHDALCLQCLWRSDLHREHLQQLLLLLLLLLRLPARQIVGQADAHGT